MLQVQFWAPEAAGGGVTLVMAYLNGIFIPHLLNLRTLIAKVRTRKLDVDSQVHKCRKSTLQVFDMIEMYFVGASPCVGGACGRIL